MARQRMQFKDNRTCSVSLGNTIQGKMKKKDYSNLSNFILPIQCVTLSRNMQKVVESTVFSDEEDKKLFREIFSQKYGQDIVNEMIVRISNNSNFHEGYMDDFNPDENDDNEYGANITYHGDLDEYDDPNEIDHTINQIYPIQMARKPFTISGPKSYTGTQGSYENIAYKTGEKGDIDFSKPLSDGTIHRATVLTDSNVDLKNFTSNIDTKNRQLHFALADKLYANKKNAPNASWTTNFRKGSYTWHHMKTPYHMVLVDMVVHMKHGHNGGVYLW